jgi:hypothetical protein
MSKALAYVYPALLLLSCLLGASSQTTGSLPGCRYVVRSTNKWVLPTQYRTGTVANWQNGVCATVKNTTPVRFGVDESLYIQRDTLSRFYCPNDSASTYCVTSDYKIVKCGDLGCEKTTGGVNACAYAISRDDCTFRNQDVEPEDALASIDIYWDEVMGGIEFWLVKWAGSVGMDILSEIWGKKSLILDAVRRSFGTGTAPLTPATLRNAVVNAIKAVVPAAGNVFLSIGRKLSFPLLVWDIMNWDIFVVVAY